MSRNWFLTRFTDYFHHRVTDKLPGILSVFSFPPSKGKLLLTAVSSQYPIQSQLRKRDLRGVRL